jgi:Spy/CpxP family protein refolding chaperone
MTSFTKKWIGGIVLLLIVLIATPCFVGWRMEQVAHSMSSKMNQAQTSSLFEGLQLTKDQQDKIQKLEDEYNKVTTKACEQHCSARMKIAQLLQVGTVDSEKLLQIEKDEAQAYSTSEVATLQHVLRISDILTPDQRTVFLKKYGERIQSTCPLEFVR